VFEVVSYPLTLFVPLEPDPLPEPEALPDAEPETEPEPLPLPEAEPPPVVSVVVSFHMCL